MYADVWTPGRAFQKLLGRGWVLLRRTHDGAHPSTDAAAMVQGYGPFVDDPAAPSTFRVRRPGRHGRLCRCCWPLARWTRRSAAALDGHGPCRDAQARRRQAAAAGHGQPRIRRPVPGPDVQPARRAGGPVVQLRRPRRETGAVLYGEGVERRAGAEQRDRRGVGVRGGRVPEQQVRPALYRRPEAGIARGPTAPTCLGAAGAVECDASALGAGSGPCLCEDTEGYPAWGDDACPGPSRPARTCPVRHHVSQRHERADSWVVEWGTRWYSGNTGGEDGNNPTTPPVYTCSDLRTRARRSSMYTVQDANDASKTRTIFCDWTRTAAGPCLRRSRADPARAR